MAQRVSSARLAASGPAAPPRAPLAARVAPRGRVATVSALSASSLPLHASPRGRHGEIDREASAPRSSTRSSPWSSEGRGRSALPASAARAPLAVARAHGGRRGDWSMEDFTSPSPSPSSSSSSWSWPSWWSASWSLDLFDASAVSSPAPSALQRVAACALYLVPLFDGLRYAQPLFRLFPPLVSVLRLFGPLLAAYSSIPFASTIVFFAIYIGVAQNRRQSAFLRQSAHQSILLSMVLIVPSILEMIAPPPVSGPLAVAYRGFFAGVAILLYAGIAYSVAFAALGKIAPIPIVTDAAAKALDGRGER